MCEKKEILINWNLFLVAGEIMSELPFAAVARLMKNSGAKRVAVSGVQALQEILEEYAMEVADQANQIARHSGRKTVMAKDIKLALRT